MQKNCQIWRLCLWPDFIFDLILSHPEDILALSNLEA